MEWAVRINDYPDEPLYTLMVELRELIYFDDWLALWSERPAFLKLNTEQLPAAAVNKCSGLPGQTARLSW
jgi:hypothetical protein